jgi:hypothetical protein
LRIFSRPEQIAPFDFPCTVFVFGEGGELIKLEQEELFWVLGGFIDRQMIDCRPE